MSIDVARLGKTLSDETRVKVLRTLKRDGPMSYVDLMEALGITNTGKLNYHLKVLGELIRKEGSEGRYELSPKGVVALDFLDKFQTLTHGIEAGLISVPSAPYEKTARYLQTALALEAVAVILINVSAYLVSPALIPLHYAFDGRVYSTAPREIFLLLAALLNIPQVVFLLLSVSRYRLINRYPFAISLPGFRSNLSTLDYERRGYWINRFFSGILGVGLVVGGMMVFLTVSIYESAASAVDVPAYAVVLTVVVVGLAVLGLVYLVLGYSREMAADAKR